MHAAHQLGLVLREVVVDRDDVDALALEGVEVGRQRGDQGLALAGLHLGDVAEVQRGAAHDLDVEVPLAERALGRLADRGERLGEEVVEGLAVGEAGAELVGHRAQLGVGHRDEVVLDGVDLLRDGRQLAQDLALAGAEHLVEKSGHAGTPRAVRVAGRPGAGPRLLTSHRRRSGLGLPGNASTAARVPGWMALDERVPYPGPVTLTDGRLLLRLPEPGDVPAITAACQDRADRPVRPGAGAVHGGARPAVRRAAPGALAGRGRRDDLGDHRCRGSWGPAARDGRAARPRRVDARDRVLDGALGPRPWRHDRRRPAGRAGSASTCCTSSGSSGGRSSATTRPAGWPRSSASGWRAPGGPGCCTAASALDAWVRRPPRRGARLMPVELPRVVAGAARATGVLLTPWEEARPARDRRARRRRPQPRLLGVAARRPDDRRRAALGRGPQRAGPGRLGGARPVDAGR